MSKSPVRRCFAAKSAPCATSRTGRLPEPPGHSLWRPHQSDEDVFERGFGCAQVAEPNARAAEIGEQGGDAGALALGVVGVSQFAAVRRKGEMIGAERRRNRGERRMQLQCQLL